MTVAKPDTYRTRLGLTRDVSSRQLPLATLLVAIMALFAPVVYLFFGLREQRDQAGLAARQVAELISVESEGNSQLWKYNTPKLVAHLLTYRTKANVRRIEVTDSDGRRINTGPEPASVNNFTDLWNNAPILIAGQQVGIVWAALDSRWLYRDAALIFFLFFGVGSLLVGLLIWIPQHSLTRAEQRIAMLLDALDASRKSLTDLNQNLELQVSMRSEQLASTYRDLQVQDRRLRELSQKAILLQENERRLIARELHDAVGGALTAIRINLQLIRGQTSGHACTSLIEKTTRLTDETLEEVRRVVASLGPAILDEVGLVAAIERHLDDFVERTGVDVHREIHPIASPISPVVENACFRMIQEALTNVVKHAKANRVWVRLQGSADRLSIEVEDDGCGFIIADQHQLPGHGLIGIRERSTLLSGNVQLTSTPGVGTKLQVELPFLASLQDNYQLGFEEERESR